MKDMMADSFPVVQLVMSPFCFCCNFLFVFSILILSLGMSLLSIDASCDGSHA